MLSRQISNLRLCRALFVAEIRGVAAVEFAYIAPLLILALFGTIEVSRGVMMHKRFQRVSAMIGDLVSREQTVGTAPGQAAATINGMMESASHVMAPFSVSTLKIKVNSLRAKSDDANQTKSEWTYSYPQKTAVSTCNTKAMPTSNMLSKGNTAIVIEAEYTFYPILQNLIPGFESAIQWNDVITHSPRKASCVAFEGNNCGMLCPGW